MNVNYSDLKVGQRLSLTSYFTITDILPNQITVNTDHGETWTVGRKVVEQGCYSANQFTEERAVNKTQLAEVFSKVGDAVFTVEYVKKDGSDRMLIGYMLNRENIFARALVHDLEKGEPRLVDYRTLKSLIYKNIKYVVK